MMFGITGAAALAAQMGGASPQRERPQGRPSNGQDMQRGNDFSQFQGFNNGGGNIYMQEAFGNYTGAEQPVINDQMQFDNVGFNEAAKNSFGGSGIFGMGIGGAAAMNPTNFMSRPSDNPDFVPQYATNGADGGYGQGAMNSYISHNNLQNFDMGQNNPWMGADRYKSLNAGNEYEGSGSGGSMFDMLGDFAVNHLEGGGNTRTRPAGTPSRANPAGNVGLNFNGFDSWV